MFHGLFTIVDGVGYYVKRWDHNPNLNLSRDEQLKSNIENGYMKSVEERIQSPCKIVAG